MSVYAVDKLCRRVVHEPALREALNGSRETAEAAIRSSTPPLSDQEVRLVLDGEVGKLGQMGCNYFLLHQLGRWEVLGMTLKLHGERVRAAQAEAAEHAG